MSALNGPKRGDVVQGAAKERTKRQRRSERSHLSNAVAARIRQLRVARRWTQKQLAKKAGLSNDAISSIERGRRAAQLDTLEQIAKGLGVSLPTLVDVGGPPPRERRESERLALLLQESFGQMPPWLAEAMLTAIRIILRAARKAKRSSGGPPSELPKNQMGRPYARLLQGLLEQLPPWLADAVTTAIGTIPRARTGPGAAP
jgi:transcriptional regulator with XRE-family HTH domain